MCDARATRSVRRTARRESRIDGARRSRARRDDGDARRRARDGRRRARARDRRRARGVAEATNATRGDARDDDGDANLAREIAAARAASLRRRKTTWGDARGDDGDGGRARRAEINFPASREEYEELLERHRGRERAATDAARDEKRPRARDGDEDDARDGEAAWTVAAVMVAEDGRGGEDAATAREDADARWVQSYDAESDAFYYFHATTLETTWERPSGVEIVPDEIGGGEDGGGRRGRGRRRRGRRENARSRRRARTPTSRPTRWTR